MSNSYLPYDTKIKICAMLAGIQMIRRSTATIVWTWKNGISSKSQCLGTTLTNSGTVSRRYVKRHSLHSFWWTELLNTWVMFILFLQVFFYGNITLIPKHWLRTERHWGKIVWCATSRKKVCFLVLQMAISLSRSRRRKEFSLKAWETALLASVKYYLIIPKYGFKLYV